MTTVHLKQLSKSVTLMWFEPLPLSAITFCKISMSVEFNSYHDMMRQPD